MTRADVARLAKVSTAVVSYVMNNGPKRVAPATEKRVRDAIAELAYRPNLTARALSSGSTRMLGLVIPDIRNPFFADYAYAIESEAARRGYSLLISHSDGDAANERTRVAELIARQVDGLLLASMLTESELADELASGSADQASPALVLNTDLHIDGVATVGPGFEAATRLGVQHLIDHGHRRIGLITGHAAGPATEPREESWRATLSDAGLRPGPIRRGHYTRESGYRMTRQLLHSAQPPTAVFAVSDLLGIGALRAAHELGVVVPGDLAVVSFDGSRESEYSWPPLTSVQQPIEEMAVHAIGLLLDPTATLSRRTFDSTLIVRQSCGCPPGPVASAPRTPA